MSISFLKRLKDYLDKNKKIKTKPKDDFDLRTKKNTMNLNNNKISKFKNEGQKIKIYDGNDKKKFVEIIWPNNPTVEKIANLIAEKLNTKTNTKK